MRVKSLFNIIIGILLGLSILLPTVLQSVKIPLLALCLVLGLIYLANIKKTSYVLLMCSIFYVFIGLFWTILGQLRGNPGATVTMTVMVVYPLLMTILAYCFEVNDLVKLKVFFLVIGLFLAIFNLTFVLSELLKPGNLFSEFIFQLNKDDAVIDASAEYFKFTLPSIASVIFLLPFCFATLLSNSSHKKIAFVSSILLIFVIVLSGRRAGFVAPLMGIFFAYLITISRASSLSLLKFLKLFFYFIFTALVVVIFFNAYYSSDAYFNSLLSIFDFENNPSNLERVMQFNALIDGIASSPFFGEGAGAAASYSRSEIHPWAYELTYVAFLFQYGIIGTAIYVAGIFWLILNLVQKIKYSGRDCFEFPFLAGFISFMIANATNPYLAKFDYMWVIFIPVAILNLQLSGIKKNATYN
jgi:O-antigen ligase